MQGRVIGAVEGDDYVWRQGGNELARKPLSDLGKKFDKALDRNKHWERPQ